VGGAVDVTVTVEDVVVVVVEDADDPAYVNCATAEMCVVELIGDHDAFTL
jgi:hypothetical protein